jgi:hypothetical protein
MWKNIVKRGRPQMTIRRMRVACWISKATDIHSQYVILNAFPLQQWLCERSSILRYTYIAIFFNPVIFANVYWNSDKKSSHIPAVLRLELLNKWPLKETCRWRSFQTWPAQATVPVDTFEMTEHRLTLSMGESMENSETVLKTFELSGGL